MVSSPYLARGANHEARVEGNRWWHDEGAPRDDRGRRLGLERRMRRRGGRLGARRRGREQPSARPDGGGATGASGTALGLGRGLLALDRDAVHLDPGPLLGAAARQAVAGAPLHPPGRRLHLRTGWLVGASALR